jgi:transcription initiation factor TFIID subunit 9B
MADPTTAMTSTNPQNNSQPPLPSDAAAVRRVLRSMGVDAMEPRVGRALLDFVYRYTADALLAAEHFAAAAGRPPGEVEAPDVTLALQAQAAAGAFAAPAPVADVFPLAAALNSVPLPAAGRRFGLRLPPEGDCLTQPNWQVDAEALERAAAEERQQQWREGGGGAAAAARGTTGGGDTTAMEM